jgi:NTE family protein
MSRRTGSWRPVGRNLTALALGLAPLAVLGAPAGSQDTQPPARIGLVLSGGGALGAAHVGVLKVLEELRVPVHTVVGTSMGAVVGGLYASGLSAEDLERELLAVDWPAVFRDEVPRELVSFRRKEEQRQLLLDQEVGIGLDGIHLPGGLVEGHRIGLMLETLLLPVLAEDDFNDLPIPFRAAATDIETGALVVLDRGHLPRAIRASMAVPFALAPVKHRGRLLVDGGFVEHLPLEVVRDLALDLVIAVAVHSDLKPRDGLGSSVDVAVQVVRLSSWRNMERALERGGVDLLIRPNVDSFSSGDFPHSQAIMDRGEEAARAAKHTLLPWSLPEAEYRAWREGVLERRGGAVVPEFIRVELPDQAAVARIESHISTRPGMALDTAILRRDLDRIYGLGTFDQVGFEVVREKGRVGLVVRPVPKSVGLGAVRFGLALTDDFGGSGAFQLVAQFLRLRLTNQGGELRIRAALGEDRALSAELYQPAATGSPVFLEAQVRDSHRTALMPTMDTNVARRVHRTGVGGGLGLHAGTWAEATVGLVVERVDAASDGDSAVDLPAFAGWQGGVVARLEVDRLEDAAFPRHGFIFRSELHSTSRRLGDVDRYDRLSADLTWALSHGRNTVLMGAVAGRLLRGEMPFYDHFRLGGFQRLSGLPPNSVMGNEMVLGRLAYFRTMGAAGVLRVGGALEAGDAWSDGRAVSLDRLRPSAAGVVALESVLGAMYLGIGFTEGGHWAGHLFLGNPFH